MKLEEKLAALRRRQGLSQMDLAEQLGVSRQSVSRWEVGTSVPSIENLKALSVIYNVSLDDLLGDEAREPPEGEGILDHQESSGEPKRKRRWPPVFALFLAAAVLVVAGILIGIHMRTGSQEDAATPTPMEELMTDNDSETDGYATGSFSIMPMQ